MLQNIIMILLLSLTLQAKTIKERTKECDSGSGLACLIVADAYDSGFYLDIKKKMYVKKDPKKALLFYHNACNYHSSKACNKIGLVYQNGLLGSKVYKKRATHYFKRSCKAKYAKGCLNLGLSYLHGVGVKENINAAAGYFKKGCSFGLKQSCDKYKTAFKKSLKENANILKACSDGNISQCYFIGMIYK